MIHFDLTASEHSKSISDMLTSEPMRQLLLCVEDEIDYQMTRYARNQMRMVEHPMSRSDSDTAHDRAIQLQGFLVTLRELQKQSTFNRLKITH